MSHFLKNNFVIAKAILFPMLVCFSALAANQDDFDIIYYEIDLSVNPQTEIIDGSVTVQAISEIDGLSQLTLDLYDNMDVSAITGNAADFSHANNRLIINLDRLYNNGETVSVTVFYSGHPATVDNFHPMTFDRSRSTVTVSSESCPFYARCWWPCKDRPDDKPQLMDIKITVPSNLTVAANGVLINSQNNGDGTKTFHWQVKNPIATYLVAFSISNYQIMRDQYINAQLDTLAIMNFVYPEHYNRALIDFDNVSLMIEILESYYGQYPYMNEKYSIVEYVGYWGGMEYQTLTSVQPYFVSGDHAHDDLFVHELAHQWWGDCVSPKDFHHTWISEGFATFSEALYFGFLEGQEKYHNYMNNENNAIDIKGRIYRDDVTDPDAVYGSIVYYKGAWVLHMLRHVVGEEKFWSGLREYRARFEFGSATTEDLQQVFEEVTGDSLNWFFHQWIYEADAPHYAYGWQEEPITGNYVIKLFIDQIQTETPLFKMPVDITLQSASSETTITVLVEDSAQSFLFTPSATITDVKVDKDNWLLKKTTQFTTPIINCLSHSIDDSAENANGLAEPGETVQLAVTVKNYGLSAYQGSIILSTQDPTIHLPKQVYEFTTLGSVPAIDHLAKQTTFPFIFSVSADAQGHLSLFKVEINANDNYTATDSFYVKIGNPNVLLVDDDAGANYEFYFSGPMSLAKIYSNSWDVFNQGSPSYAEVLKKYQTVIWFTGDDKKNSLTISEQLALAEFLESGGRLLLTGQNIGYDLITDGSAADSLFFTNYLQAELIKDSLQATMMMGFPSDPITSGLFLNIDARIGGAGNQTSPSAIRPVGNATAILKYLPSQSVAGIRWLNETTGSRLVYLSFGYEGISGPYANSAEKFLSYILTWLSGSTEIKIIDNATIPEKYLLEQNFPNPFNPATQIKFHLPKEEFVTLSIYNLMGQKIKDLIAEKLPPGIYEKSWDGTSDLGDQLASGIYLLKLKSGSFSSVKKLILAK